MALQLFEVEGGLSDGRISYLSGIGAPGGDASFQDAANVGSYYVDDTGTRWTKHTSGAGTSNWETMATTADLSALGNVQVWREPVVALEEVSITSSAAVTLMNVGDTIDGVTIAAGDRVLLSAVTDAVGANVYIVGGSTGAWTLTEDVNNETDGDTVSVLGGTIHQNQVWMFNTATGGWGLIGQQTTTGEETFIRSFIGKGAAGGELPAYTSVFYVANGDSLETAIGKLDAQVGQNTTAIAQNSSAIGNMQTELDNTQAGAGLSVGGVYNTVAGSNFISGAVSIHDATSLIDAALGTTNVNVSDEVANRILAVSAVQAELDTVEASIGLSVTGAYIPFVGTSYMDAATSIVTAMAAIDAQVATNASGLAQEILDRGVAVGNVDAKIGSGIYTGSITGSVDVTTALNTLESQISNAVAKSSAAAISAGVVDSVLVDDAKLIVWEVAITEAGTPANNRSYTVKAMHDGTALADATFIDHNKSASLRLGSPIAGLVVDVVLSGAGVTQTAQLTVAATNPVDVSVLRLNA